MYQENDNLTDGVKDLTGILKILTDCLINRFNFDIKDLGTESECKEFETEAEWMVWEQQAPGGGQYKA